MHLSRPGTKQSAISTTPNKIARHTAICATLTKHGHSGLYLGVRKYFMRALGSWPGGCRLAPFAPVQARSRWRGDIVRNSGTHGTDGGRVYFFLSFRAMLGGNKLIYQFFFFKPPCLCWGGPATAGSRPKGCCNTIAALTHLRWKLLFAFPLPREMPCLSIPA